MSQTSSSNEPLGMRMRVEGSSVKGEKTLDDIVLEVLGETGSLVGSLDTLISVHGVETIQRWRLLNSKHKHGLVHELVRRKKLEALQHMVQQHKFDINIQRESDLCTPLHLSGWTKDSELMALCVRLGADPTLKNAYGEDCSQVLESAKKSENLMWLDLELTHLPKDKDVTNAILEVALVITTPSFKELARGTWVIHHTKEELESLSEWHSKQFCSVESGGNGLFEDVAKSSLSKETVEQKVLALMKEHGMEGGNKLCGNSVHCDREVLLSAMPSVYTFISHQVIDVSTVLNLTLAWMPQLGSQIPPHVSYNHRAENDVDSSIAMLKWFREHLFTE